ncbi:MAG: hypothetical protein EP343_29975 [Deltaproteobacteria bacterium]|nr:MAG: hypothetical protein EP343_29975 [Deltaproteobacteria bacterium]
MSKKKRTKTKKSSAAEENQEVTETEVTETEEEVAEASDAEDKEKVKADDKTSEETEEEASSEEAEDVDAEEEDKPSPSQQAKDMVERAEKWLEAGNNQEARELLIQVVDMGASLEEREKAHALLKQIELDTRPLLVGAVAMLTLVLIPTVGLVKALWALPLLLPILLPTVPGTVAMLSFWSIPFLLPMKMTWHVKFFAPVIGLILALVLLIVQRPLASDTEGDA